MQDLAKRIQRLEDIEAIKQLKARYFHACDQKQLETILCCFAEGKVWIDYGKIGSFETREAFLKVYEEMACHDHIIDMHHGMNFQIDWQDEAHASGICDLFFHQIDKKTGLISQLGGFYQDRFEKIAGEWVMTETVFNVTSCFVSSASEGNFSPMFLGRKPE